MSLPNENPGHHGLHPQFERGTAGDGAIVAAADEERFTREKFTGDFPQGGPRVLPGTRGHGIGGRGLAGVLLESVVRDRTAGPDDGCALCRTRWRFSGRRARTMPAARGDFGSWWNMVNVARRDAEGISGRAERGSGGVLSSITWRTRRAHITARPGRRRLSSRVDGTGEWTTTLMARGRGTRIEKLGAMAYPHSLGVLYGAVTQYLGYRIYQDEWKIMGLAALGSPRYRGAGAAVDPLPGWGRSGWTWTTSISNTRTSGRGTGRALRNSSARRAGEDEPIDSRTVRGSRGLVPARDGGNRTGAGEASAHSWVADAGSSAWRAGWR